MKLLLLIRPAGHPEQRLRLNPDSHTPSVLQARPHTRYHLIDEQTGRQPANVTLRRKSGRLLVLLDDRPVLVLDGYDSPACQGPADRRCEFMLAAGDTAMDGTPPESPRTERTPASTPQIVGTPVEPVAPTPQQTSTGLAPPAVPAPLNVDVATGRSSSRWAESWPAWLAGAGALAGLASSRTPAAAPPTRIDPPDQGAVAGDLQITGRVSAGVIQGGVDVLAYGDAGQLLGRVEVMAGGQFSLLVKGRADYRGAVLLKAVDTNGQAGTNYIDESTGQATTLTSALRSQVLVDGGTSPGSGKLTITAQITPLTEVIVRAATGAVPRPDDGTERPADPETIVALAGQLGLAIGTTYATNGAAIDLLKVEPNVVGTTAYRPADINQRHADAADAYGAALAALSGLEQRPGGLVGQALGGQAAIDSLAQAANTNNPAAAARALSNLQRLIVAGAQQYDRLAPQRGEATPVKLTDSTPPSADLRIDRPLIGAGQQARLHIRMSEPVSDATLDDLALTGGRASNLIVDPNDPRHLIATLTPDASASRMTVRLRPASIQDAFGNLNLAVPDGSDIRSLDIDRVAPTVVLSSAATSLKVMGRAVITIKLSEPSDDFSLAAVKVDSGQLSDLSLSPTNPLVLTAIYTPAADARAGQKIRLSVAAGAFHDRQGLAVQAPADDPSSPAAALTLTLVTDNTAPSGSVIVNGTPLQGQTLVASHTLVDAQGLGNIAYQWLADGIAISGATGSTLVLAQALVGRKISVRASYRDGELTDEAVTSAPTAVIANLNDPPTGQVTITGTVTQGQTLTASNTLADIDGLGSIAYQWLADGIAISGATGPTLVLAQAHVGHQISVRASYRDGGLTDEAVTSAPTAVVANINDLPTGQVTISGTATQGQTLTALNTLADIDGLGSISYQWLADGIAISGATGSTLVLTQVHVGRQISVRASYRDGGLTDEAVTSAPTNAVTERNDAPTGQVTITGIAMQGQTLTASNTLADIDGLGSIAYQWLADGVAISGATGSTLTLTQTHVGRQISVRASYRDGGLTDEAVTSAPTNAVVDVNEAPRAGNQSLSLSLDEDGELAFSAASFGFVDAAGEAGALAAVLVTALPSAGRLTLDGANMSLGQAISAGDLARLVYRPAANAHGESADRWSFRVRDNGGTAHGGVDTSTSDAVMTLTVLSVNDAPLSADVSRSVSQNGTLWFAREDFAFTDPDDLPAHALLAVRIVTLPGRGRLSLDGVAVSSGQSIAVDEITRLSYTPAAGQHGMAFDRYDFAVQDAGGTVRGGVDTSATHTMTLDVVALAAPSLTLDALAGDGVVNHTESTSALLISGRLAASPSVLAGHVAGAISLRIVDLDDAAQPAIEFTASAYESTTGLWQASFDATRLTDGHRHQLSVMATGHGAAAGLSSRTQAELLVDRSPPVATFSDDAGGSVVTGSLSCTITFSEPVSGFDADDITSPNGSLGALTWIDDRRARFTVTPKDLTQGDKLDVRIGTGWQDTAGNLASTAAALRPLAWDRLPPSAPGLALASDTGLSNTDGITQLGEIKVTGLEAGATWQYTLDGSTWLDGTGLSFNLPVGTHPAARVQVRQTDAAGHVSAKAANTQAWTVDVTVARPGLSLNRDTGIDANDGYTLDPKLVFSGYETGARREISVDAGLTWKSVSTNTFDLPDGTYAEGAVLARQVDVAGNISASSGPLLTFTIDTFSPAPTWTLVTDSGFAADDDISRFGTLLLGIEAGSTWEGSTDGGLTWTRGTGNYWTLPEGRYAADRVRLKQTDLAGNRSVHRSNAKVLHIDQSIATPTLALQVDSGPSATDLVSRDGRVLVQGMDKDDTWSWSVNGTTWTTGIGQTLELPEGIHTLQVRSEDAAGNQARSATLALTVDTTRPTAPGLRLVEDSAPTGDGRSTNGLMQVSMLEANSDWAYTLDGGITWQTGSGTSFVLPVGHHLAADVQVRQVDRAGNVSSSQALAADVTIDPATGPAQPRLLATWLDNAVGIDVASAIVLDFGAVDLRAVAGLRILLVDDGGNASDGKAYALEAATHTQVFDVAGAAVSISGGRVTLQPTRHLDLASRYHVELDAGAFVDRNSGLASAGWTDASVLNFETVRPGAIGNATGSWRMAADATRQASYRWIDLSGSGDSESNQVVTTAADGGAFVHVFPDKSREPAYSALGFDGIGTDNFNVRITSFGADDLLYIDDQGRPTDVNDLDDTLMLAGEKTTTLFYGPGQDKPDGLGGQIEIALAGGLAAFGSRADWQASLGLTTSPYVIG